MNCGEYQRKRTSALPAEAAELDRHRAHCPECRSFSERLEALEAQLARRAADREDLLPRPGFSARVMAAIPERSSPLAWASARLLPLTAALALTLLAWCLVATPTPSELWAQADASDLLTWVSSNDG